MRLCVIVSLYADQDVSLSHLCIRGREALVGNEWLKERQRLCVYVCVLVKWQWWQKDEN